MELPRSKEPRCSMVRWLDLPVELVPSIARRIGSARDFVNFSAVCKTWSRAFTKQDFLGGLTHEVPFLMLPDHSNNPRRKCYDLLRGRFCELSVNTPKPKTQLNLHLMWSSCRSSLGWLIIRPQSRYWSSPDVYLFHPFEDTEIVLPSYRGSVKKFVLSSSPSLASDYTAMVCYFYERKVAFWRSKDEKWTSISLPSIPRSTFGECFDDIAFYNGQCYVVERFPSSSGNLLVCDIGRYKAELRVFAPKMPCFLCFNGKKSEQSYLVESAGNLLVVFRYYSEFHKKTVGFRVFKVPFSTDEWTEVKNLGNRALFLSDNSSSFSIETSPDYSRCKANCIYFTTDQLGTQQCGVYSMKDGQVEPLLSEVFCFVKPYIWIQPSF